MVYLKHEPKHQCRPGGGHWSLLSYITSLIFQPCLSFLILSDGCIQKRDQIDSNIHPFLVVHPTSVLSLSEGTHRSRVDLFPGCSNLSYAIDATVNWHDLIDLGNATKAVLLWTEQMKVITARDTQLA